MPVFRYTRTEVVYIEADNQQVADEVHGQLWDGQEIGCGAQGGRLGGVMNVEVVTDHTPDFRATPGVSYEETPTCGEDLPNPNPGAEEHGR